MQPDRLVGGLYTSDFVSHVLDQAVAVGFAMQLRGVLFDKTLVGELERAPIDALSQIRRQVSFEGNI